MGDYNNSNRRNFSQNRGTDRPTMHGAVCDDCGRNCKVPFKPTGNKPIYCSSCFDNQNGGRDGGRSDRGNRRNDRNDRGNDRGGRRDYGNSRGNDRGGRRDYGRDNNRGTGNFDKRDRQMFSAVCDKCHESCEVPFKPTQGKPLFCEKCFDKPGNTNLNTGTDHMALQTQMDDMTKKLDKIVASLEILAEGRMVREVKMVADKSEEDKEGPILKSDKNPVTKKAVKKKATAKKTPAKGRTGKKKAPAKKAAAKKVTKKKPAAKKAVKKTVKKKTTTKK